MVSFEVLLHCFFEHSKKVPTNPWCHLQVESRKFKRGFSVLLEFFWIREFGFESEREQSLGQFVLQLSIKIGSKWNRRC